MTNLPRRLNPDMARLAIQEAIAKFPETFGLKGHEGTFQISEDSSYINDHDVIMLYTQRRHEDGLWHDFCKASTEELKRELRLIATY